jgi:4-hydroxy-tetrahydrodipicolinate reductase
MLKIALVGYGKMGRMIHEMSKQMPIEVVALIDPTQSDCSKDITAETLKDAEVCIEFSHPSAVLDNISKICSLGKNLVLGTTGWHDKLGEVKALVEKCGIGMVYGSNLSIGMNLFYEIVEKTAQEFSKYDAYDVYGLELHHRQKADSPSGTAKELGSILLKIFDAKTNLLDNKAEGKIKPEELHFASVRAGFIPGTHTVGFDSEADTIELTHRARNRSGFALGALKASLWIQDKKGFYSFRDFIRS